jgi:DNA-binding response OmpR family regulator
MNKKILIVEDETSLMDVLEDRFCRDGFIIIKAYDGKQGVDAALKYHPDLILLDIIMPVMDGMTMLQKIRKDPWGKRVKVILLTNLSDPAKISESMVQGARDYLIKSDWKLDDIVKKVSNELNGTPGKSSK